MPAGIERDKAFHLLKKYVKSENMIKHSLASEAVLRQLARKLSHDEVKWGIAGLLHDIDVELTGGDLSIHGLRAVEILRDAHVNEEIIEAIRLHNELAHNDKRRLPFHHALAAGETITGLITATTLVYPDKKLSSVKVKSILKRMKEKGFAASVNRDIIRECELAGIPLSEFAEISLQAMQEISDDLGL